MSKVTKTAVLTVSLAIILFTVIGSWGVKASTNDGAYRQIGVMTEVLSRIQKEYVEEPDIPAVTNGALHGLVESLDADSSYLTPAEYKEYLAHKDGKANIGAAISKRFGYAAVISVIPNGPAAKAGLEPGDIIEAIAGHTSRDMSLAHINTVLSGEVGSTVDISVVRARRQDPLKLTITRDVVSIPPATDKLVESGIGYIHVDALTKGKAQEIASKVKDVEKQGAKKLILDLRNVADGDEQEGVAVANLFVDHGTLAYLEGQKFPKETFNADPSKAITKLPLVVLVNHGTAGAAELVAGAVLENGRGDVLGDKTFGVGSVQKLIQVPDGSALILSVAKYYTPGGKAIQDAAITPNILVADSNDDDVALPDDEDTAPPTEEPKTKKQDDDQLKRAIEVLKNRDTKAELVTK
jgi:carboxyl-terminal processing protease